VDELRGGRLGTVTDEFHQEATSCIVLRCVILERWLRLAEVVKLDERRRGSQSSVAVKPNSSSSEVLSGRAVACPACDFGASASACWSRQTG
jgi:hypothetical protein